VALGIVISLVVIWLAAVYFFYKNRIWLFYYLVGAVGLSFIIIFIGRMLSLEMFLEVTVANTVHQICNWVGIPTKLFQASPGSLLIMVIGQEVGWTVVQITIECSGLLEIAAMMGMVLMFPGWTLRKRALLAVIGAVTIFLANCARLFMIIIVLHNMGKDSLFISHTIIGRALFFLIVVFIYWYIITRPMLKDVRNKLHKDLEK